MKMNTKLFIGLCLSVVIAIKANKTEGRDSKKSANVNSVVTEVEKMEEVEETDDFIYMPSITLKKMEDGLSTCDREFVKDGMVKETMTQVFWDSVNMPMAKAGWTPLCGQWQNMLEGPEASRVIGTFGMNFHKIITANKDTNIINVVASTVHGLLDKIAVENRATGLSKIMEMVFTLTEAANMPDIINKLGELTMTFVQKPKAQEFTRKFYTETFKLLNDKDLNNKINKYFSTIISMMKSKTLHKKLLERNQKSESSPALGNPIFL